MEGESNLGLDLVGVEGGEALHLEEHEWERDEGEDEEEEQNVVAIEEVIGLGGGVVEPECLSEGEDSTQRRLGFLKGVVGNHRRRSGTLARW